MHEHTWSRTDRISHYTLDLRPPPASPAVPLICLSSLRITVQQVAPTSPEAQLREK